MAKETKRVRAAELKSSLKIDSITPHQKKSVTTTADTATSTTSNSANEKFKNRTASTTGSFAERSRLSEAGISKAMQEDLVHLAPQTKVIGAKTNETMVSTGTAPQTTTHTKSNDDDTKKLQLWLEKVHEAIMPHKLSRVAEVDKASDTTSSDDFEVAENAGLKVDRQREWLAVVLSLIQTYKEQAP